jgi:hypothetical protein
MAREPIDDPLNGTIERWGALGAGFDAGDHFETPDLERLILDTARCAPRSARLVAASATWLDAYAGLVALHRLKRLVRDELDPRDHPALGFLLDSAQRDHHQPPFATVTKLLTPASECAPLYDDQRTNAAMVALAERRSSALAQRWGVWAQGVETKPDALRPAHWLMRTHPTMRLRADFRGDLRASVLASLRFDEGAGSSEVALARCAGGSRSQVRNALANLEMTGRITRTPADDANRTIIRPAA